MDIDLRLLFDLARSAHAYHKAHHKIEVVVTQQTDDLGIRLCVDLQAAIPDGAVVFAHLSGAWLGKLSAVDVELFRDADGNFVTIGPVVGQRSALYIPYAAASNRGPGLYNLELSVQLIGNDLETFTEVGHAVVKIALPEQRPWRRMLFFAPLIQLSMAVIRVDDEVLPIEIRGLKTMLGENLTLSPQDITDLRTLMKAPVPDDLTTPLQSLLIRIPLLTPESTVELLAEVARLDGAINAHEFAVLSHIADLLEIPRKHHAELLAAPPQQSLLAAKTS